MGHPTIHVPHVFLESASPVHAALHKTCGQNLPQIHDDFVASYSRSPAAREFADPSVSRVFLSESLHIDRSVA